MKKILTLLFLMAFSVGCRGSLPATPPPATQTAPARPTENLASLTPPAAAPLTTATPVPSVSPLPTRPEPAATAEPPTTAVPVPSASPIPTHPEPTATAAPSPAVRWYWGLDHTANTFYAIDQRGEKHAIGSLQVSPTLQSSGFPLDAERVLFFTYDQNVLRAYLLDLTSVQPVRLSAAPGLGPDAALAWATLRVVGSFGDSVLFSYVTIRATNYDPDAGPLWLVNLKTLTAEQIEPYADQDGIDDPRLRFHASADGRTVRYVAGTQSHGAIREVDLVSGTVRTIYPLAEALLNVTGSPQGDLWALYGEKIILDIGGHQTGYPRSGSFAFRGLANGHGVAFPRECADNCELRDVSPFGGAPDIKYTLPWGIEGATYYPLISQLLPDHSLIFVGEGYAQLQTRPALVKSYPDLAADDEPVFRLTPDGRARLVGLYRSAEFATDTIPISADGRYLLLKSLDHKSLFIYDAVADRALFDLPAYADQNPVIEVKFFDTGILVATYGDVTPTGANNNFHAYVYGLAKTIAWDAGGAQFADCEDLLPDGSLICWTGPDPMHTDLVQYQPATGAVVTLQKNLGPVH